MPLIEEDDVAASAVEEERNAKRKRVWLILGIMLLVLLVILGACGLFFNGSGDDADVPDTVPESDIKVLAAEGVSEKISLNGFIEGSRTAQLSGGLGTPITEIKVKPGDRVEEGQVIATVDTGDLERQLEKAEKAQEAEKAAADKQVDAAANAYEQARLAYNDATEWASYEEILPYAEDYNNAEQALTEARKAANGGPSDEARASVDELRKKLKEATITAPWAGVISEVRGEVGMPSEGPVATLVDDGSLKITGAVRESDIDKVKKDAEVTFTTPATGEREYTGKVSAVSPVAGKDAPEQQVMNSFGISGGTAQPSTRDNSRVTFPIEITVTGEKDGLRVGSSARADIIIELEPDALTVPLEAVVDNTILAIDGEGVLRERKVTTGQSNDFDVAISGSDIKEGDEVVVRPGLYRHLVGTAVVDYYEE